MIMNLDYKLIGKNSPAIVFLHGWGMSKECFDDIIQKIDEGPMILSLDFFGFGKSLEPKEYFDTYEYAYSVYLLLCKLNIKDVILVGHSFGGRVSIILSSIFNINVHYLILTSSAGINRFSVIRKIKVTIYKIKKYLVSKKILSEKNISNSGSEDYRNLSQLMKKVFVKVVNQDLTCLLEKIDVKTYLVWDKKDNATPYFICKKLHNKIKKSKVVLYSSGGHFCYLKNKNKFASLINYLLN